MCDHVPCWYPHSGAGAGQPPIALDRRGVAVIVLISDMGPIVPMPLLGELPAAALSYLLAPQAPPVVADLKH